MSTEQPEPPTLTALREARADLEIAEREHFQHGFVSRDQVEQARGRYLRAVEADEAARAGARA